MAEDLEADNSSVETNPLKEKYEPLLWKRAEKLQTLRNSLEDHQAKLYEQIEEMQKKHLNLHVKDQLGKKEAEYWRIQRKMGTIEEKEDVIVEAIDGLVEGTIDEEVLQDIVPPPQEDTEEVSKKKKAMQDEAERLGVSQAELDWDMDVAFGPNPTRLTTGRNRKRLRGSYSPDVAAGEFFYQTADTHGGKVKHGKKSDTYVSKSGKRIRKK